MDPHGHDPFSEGGAVSVDPQPFDTATARRRRSGSGVGFESFEVEVEPQDLNNNSMDINNGPVSGIPRVSTSLALLMVALFYGKEYIGITSEDMIFVSWDTVITKGQVWRLLYAHFFNFSKVSLWVNCLALVSVGRYVEKKVQRTALLVIIQTVGMSSSLLYIMLNSWICSGVNNDHTYGFNMIVFSLRIIHMYTKAKDPRRRSLEPDLIFGCVPVNCLPVWVVPWLPAMEIMLFEVLILDRCVLGNISGLVSTGPFPYCAHYLPSWVMIPTRPLNRSVHTLTLPLPSDVRHVAVETNHHHAGDQNTDTEDDDNYFNNNETEETGTETEPEENILGQEPRVPNVVQVFLLNTDNLARGDAYSDVDEEDDEDPWNEEGFDFSTGPDSGEEDILLGYLEDSEVEGEEDIYVDS